MEIRASKHEGAVVLELAGTFDTAASRDLDGEIQAALATGVKCVAVDLGKVELLTSACIRLLVTLNRRLTPLGGALLLCALNPHVQEVFEVAGIAVHFKSVPSQADALAQFAAHSAPAAVVQPRVAALTQAVVSLLERNAPAAITIGEAAVGRSASALATRLRDLLRTSPP